MSSESDAGTYAQIREAIRDGRLDEAMRDCRVALAIDQKDAEAHTLLGLIGLKLRRSDLIETSLSAAIEARPDSVEALVLLAKYNRDLMRFADVKECCLRALAVQPEEPSALTGLGHVLLEEWKTDEALAAFERAVASDPSLAEAHDGRGIALDRLQRFDEARAAFARAIELDPEETPAYVGATMVAPDPSDANQILDAALARFADAPSKLTDIGRAFWLRGKPKFGERALRAALEVDPDSAFTRRMLGRILVEGGDFDTGRTIFRAALLAYPMSIPLYEEFAFSTTFKEEDRPFLIPMTGILRNRGLDPMDRRRLNFALGKAYEDLGEYSRAMQYFDEANGIGHMQIWPKAFDRDKLTREVDSAIATYTPEFFDRNKGVGNPTEEPILIVGMLRSGTTLVEQVISSHPSVGAAGEVMYLVKQPAQMVDGDGAVDGEALDTYFERYLGRLRSVAPGSSRIIDKLPQNFMRAGLVHLALPNARIVHTRRNPLDTCLSIYVTRSVVEYAHSFSDMAFYYREYERLMAHWRDVLPRNRLFELDYEALITDREPIVRELVEFLGLPWDDALMRHESNVRSVDTLSVWQVRQPIYNTSVERWRRYAPWIEDLLREFPERQGPTDRT